MSRGRRAGSVRRLRALRGTVDDAVLPARAGDVRGRLTAGDGAGWPVRIDGPEPEADGGRGRGAGPDDGADGLRLSDLVRLRAPLTDEEAAGVVAGLADAVALDGRDGRERGRVGPEDVLVRPDGSTRLLPPTGAGQPAVPVGEVLRSVVVTVLAAMPDATLDRLGREDAGTTLRAELERALAATEVTAAGLVEACRRAAVAEPVRRPDPAVLARAQVVAGAQVVADAQVVAGATGPGTVRPGRRHRAAAARGGGRPGRWAAALLVVGVLVGAVGVVAAGTGPVVTAPGEEEAVVPDPVAAAAELTERRARVVGAGDADGLDGVDVPGGPAHVADRALLADLAEVRVDGLRATVEDARLLPGAEPTASGAGGAPGQPTLVRVAVRSAMSAHTRMDLDGTVTQVPASPARTVVLGLRRTSDGWRVWDVHAQQDAGG